MHVVEGYRLPVIVVPTRMLARHLARIVLKVTAVSRLMSPLPYVPLGGLHPPSPLSASLVLLVAIPIKVLRRASIVRRDTSAKKDDNNSVPSATGLCPSRRVVLNAEWVTPVLPPLKFYVRMEPIPSKEPLHVPSVLLDTHVRMEL